MEINLNLRKRGSFTKPVIKFTKLNDSSENFEWCLDIIHLNKEIP